MAAPDRFTENNLYGTAPLTRGVSIVPDNSNELAFRPRAVWVGTAGALTVILGGNTITFVGVPAGTLLPIRPDLIRTTGTTAGNILILD